MGSIERADEFAEDLRREAVTMTEDEVRVVVRAVGIKALTELVKVTPVDTGYARAGWQVSFDSPSASEPDAGASDKTGQATASAGQRAIEKAPDFPHIWLTNNVHYIEVLDDGRLSGEAVGEGDFAFGAGVNGPARRTGARGSIQAPDGILNPVFDDLVTALQSEES